MTPLAWLMLALAAAVTTLILRKRWYRLGNSPDRPQAPEPSIAIGLAAGMVVAGAVGVWLAGRMLWPGGPPEGLEGLTLADEARLLLGQNTGRLLIVAAFVVARTSMPPPASDRRLSHGRSAIVGLLVILAIWPLLQTVSMAGRLVASWTSGVDSDTVAHETLRRMLESAGDGWFFLVATLVVLAAPLCEEVLYRGLLQHALVRAGLGRWPSIVFTSVVFMLMHVGAVEPYALPSLFVLSLGFGWAFERTGRLTTPILMHVVFNAANLALAMVVG